MNSLKHRVEDWAWDRVKPLRKAAAESAFRGISGLARLHPKSRLKKHGVERIKNIAYLDSGLKEHLLDIYRPVNLTGPAPVVFHVHGGSFRMLSKDTHWIMGLMFARAGFVVVNISYRLCPEHPFPGGLSDSCAALNWTLDHISEYGGDPQNVILAGESAGGNLALSTALCSLFKRPEPFAEEIYERRFLPKAVLPICGLLQVTNMSRLFADNPSGYVRAVVRDVETDYLGTAKDITLANPLVLLESEIAPERELPPFFITCGASDPIVDDSRRLHRALEGRGANVEYVEYPEQGHAFHAFIWKQAAQQCWRDMIAFCHQTLEN